MWRTRAVIAMLIEEVAGLQPGVAGAEHDGGADDPGEAAALDRAMRRTRLVILIDCLAIVILFLFRDTSRPFLLAEQSVEVVFTLGVLAVAAHAGFRLAQLQNLRTVRRLSEELRERQGT